MFEYIFVGVCCHCICVSACEEKRESFVIWSSRGTSCASTCSSAEGHSYATVCELVEIQRRNTVVMRSSVFFFLSSKSWRETLSRVETATHLNSRDRVFHRSLCKFYYSDFVFHWISCFNALNERLVKASYLGSFVKGEGRGGGWPVKGYGSRGSAGAGREAVSLCRRGRTTRSRRYLSVVMEVWSHPCC